MVLYAQKLGAVVGDVGKRRVGVHGEHAKCQHEGERGAQVARKADLDLAAAHDVDAQHDEQGMVDKELVGDGVGKGLARLDAIGKDGRQRKSQKRAKDAGGIHEGENRLATARALGKAHVEDEEDLDGAQVEG